MPGPPRIDGHRQGDGQWRCGSRPAIQTHPPPSLRVGGPPSVEPVRMGEVTGLRRTWKAPEEPMDEPVTFEEFFEEQKDRLLRILSVITGSRAEAEDLAQ